MLPDDDAEIAKIKAAWKAGIEAAPLSFPDGDGADLSSIPGDLGSEVGGMQRGGGLRPPPLPGSQMS